MTKKIVVDIYDNPITIENLEKTWKTVRSTCKNRKAVYRFALNKNTNIYNIYNMLKSKKYLPYRYTVFLIFEPKPRLVMSQSVGDKVVNHFIANYYLLPYLESKLINSNVATRKGKGSKAAEQLLTRYINSILLKNKNEEVFCLKLDISKYFYNINHEILINMLEKDIKDKDVLNIIKNVIDETNKPYVNQSMDDIIILDNDKSKLKELWKIIEIKLEELKLKINPKSSIVRLSNGLTFLGFRYVVINNKLKVKYRKKTIKKIRKTLKILEEKDKMKYYRSYGSYYGYLKKVDNECERRFKMKTKEKYEYFKEKRPKCIVIVKEGSFYKTYGDDAVIIWYLFDYKWNNDSIAFGTTPYSKVISKLAHSGFGYSVITTDEEYVPGDNNEIYDLYLKIAQINFDKFKKKEELLNLFNEVIENNNEVYDPLKKFLLELKGSEINE